MTGKHEKITIGRLAAMALLILFSPLAYSQTSNSDFERIKLISTESDVSGLTLSPDQKTLALSFARSEPIKIIDWQNRSISKEINAGIWNSGSRLNFTTGGKYLLAQEIGFSDFSQKIGRASCRERVYVLV